MRSLAYVISASLLSLSLSSQAFAHTNIPSRPLPKKTNLPNPEERITFGEVKEITRRYDEERDYSKFRMDLYTDPPPLRKQYYPTQIRIELDPCSGEVLDRNLQ